MKQRSLAELQKLLGHPDMRVRQEAQFELVSRGAKALHALTTAARSDSSPLARLHAIWGLGQLARSATGENKHDLAETILPLARDRDAEVRAQIARVIGDARLSGATPLRALLDDPSPRVRMLAGIAAGRTRQPELIPAILNLLRENNDRDPHLRHAGAFALASIHDLDAILRAASDSHPAVRMGALLALRRLERAEISRFLRDSDPRLVLEAARAINDLPLSGAMPELAELARSQAAANFSSPLLRRIVNANYRLGTSDSARTLARIAADKTFPELIRAEALGDLANWDRPSGRDPVTGLWRPVVGPRFQRYAADALEPAVASLLRDESAAVRIAAVRAIALLKLSSAAGGLLSLVREPSAPDAVRVEAVRALGTLGDARLGEAVEIASKDPAEALRREALGWQSQLKPSDALAHIETVLANGSLGEKQSAFVALGSMNEPAAERIILAWLDTLLRGQLPKELELELLEAAGKHESPGIKARLEAYQASLPKNDPLAPYRVALHGGNANDGRKVFFERAEAACVRCHKIAGHETAGSEVGPELTRIGATKDRAYLLEAIVSPNKNIAQGFETLLVTTKDGAAFAGIARSETVDELVLNSPEDGLITIKKSTITARQRGLSSMPEGLASILGNRDLRDLIEFLASLK